MRPLVPHGLGLVADFDVATQSIPREQLILNIVVEVQQRVRTDVPGQKRVPGQENQGQSAPQRGTRARGSRSAHAEPPTRTSSPALASSERLPWLTNASS